MPLLFVHFPSLCYRAIHNLYLKLIKDVSILRTTPPHTHTQITRNSGHLIYSGFGNKFCRICKGFTAD